MGEHIPAPIPPLDPAGARQRLRALAEGLPSSEGLGHLTERLYGKDNNDDWNRARVAADLVQVLGEGAAIAAIAAERRRQIEVEGWTPEHDDGHLDGSIAAAAAAYAFKASRPANDLRFGPRQPTAVWPWPASWWKPRSARENLVRAGALIAAEIDRLDRAGHPSPEAPKEA